MRVFLLGATPSFDMQRYVTPEERLAATGHNSGNQVIADGLLATFRHDSVSWDHSKGAAWANNNADIIVIAAANFLFRGFDFEGMATFLDKTNLPLVVAGLGAQASSFEEEVVLLPGTARLVAIIADRAKLIGVRGEFTRRVLEKRGVRNVQIIGCPSYYFGGPTSKLTAHPLPERPSISINGSRDVIRHAFDPKLMKDVLKRLVAEAVALDGTCVVQTELPEIRLASGVAGDEADRAAEDVTAAFAGFAEHGALESWTRRAMRVYWSVPAWRDAMKTVDFSVGTRFHGNMVALQAGTPAVIVCHDTRTAEMSEFLGLPHVSLQDAATYGLQEFYNEVSIPAIAARREELYPAYRSFLSNNGLDPV
jgi:Polysaccharide pyruvyl transferase